MQLSEIVEVIKACNEAYYLNGDSKLSDAEYDQLKEKLRELDPNNDLLKKVGEEAESLDNKVKLPNVMGSLDKYRPEDLEQLQKLYTGKELIRMAKLDGLSMQIEYKDGKFHRLMTRGDGSTGQDITERGKYMNFPKELKHLKDGTVYIFGEAITTRENFKKAKGNYKHSRNFAVGTLRPILTNEQYREVSEDIKYNCTLIDIVVFGYKAEQLNSIPKFNVALEWLKIKEGFNIVDFSLINCDEITKDYLTQSIRSYKSSYHYLTDGIVLRVNDNKEFERLGKESNGLNPKGARAVKLDLLDQFSQVGIIKEIEWNISKRGIFTPVVKLKNPLFFDGVEVNKISGVNAGYVLENNWHEGAKVSCIRSNDVIPRIIGTLEYEEGRAELPKKCPYCGSDLCFNDVFLYCGNDNCSGRNRETVVNFFAALSLEDVGYETLVALYDAGFNSYEKLIEISYDDLIKLEGYQATKALKVKSALNNCLKGITLEKLLYISQIFQNEKTSMGLTRLGWIVNAYTVKNMLASLNNEYENGKLKKLDPTVIYEIQGLGDVYIKMFIENWLSFKKLYLQLKPYLSIKMPQIVDGPLKGMSFAFTQFRNDGLEKLIKENGGEVKGVTKKTTALFAAGSSTKVKTAEKYGIPVIGAMDAESYLLELIESNS